MKVTKDVLLAQNKAYSTENAALRARISQLEADISRLKQKTKPLTLREAAKLLALKYNAPARVTGRLIEMYSAKRKEWRKVPEHILLMLE